MTLPIVNHPNVRQTLDEEVPNSGEVELDSLIIREKILHILTVYPRISVSMLQIGVGTSLMPTLWKPILNTLIQEGVVLRETKHLRTPTGRQQTYVILSLAKPAIID